MLGKSIILPETTKVFAIGIGNTAYNMGVSNSSTVVHDLYPGLARPVKYWRPIKAILQFRFLIDSVTSLEIDKTRLSGEWLLNIDREYLTNRKDITSYGIVTDRYPDGIIVYYPEDFYLHTPDNPAVSRIHLQVTLHHHRAAVPANDQLASYYWSMIGEFVS